MDGTEQFLYEIAKKYKDYDLTIYYDTAEENQLKRLRKYVRCKRRLEGEIVKCDRAFYNFNIDMIDQVKAKEHIFVSHAIYQELGYKPPIDHPKLTRWIGVSQYACNKIEEYARKLGRNDIKAELCYNPLTLELKEKVLRLVSAGRLDDKTKDNGRTLKLIEALDRYCRNTGRHYIWEIFSNPIKFNINSPNVVLMQPRIDVRPYIADSDFVIQLSNDMETYCYTINEALGYGVPVVTTPLTVCNELPIPEGARLVCNWDMSNVDEVVKQMFESEVKPFEYIPPKDSWEDILEKGESTYMEEQKKRYLVEATEEFKDVLDAERNVYPKVGEQWEVNGDRLEVLMGNNKQKKKYVNLMKEIKEEKKPTKRKTKKVEE